jgi:heat shock protein HslJ
MTKPSSGVEGTNWRLVELDGTPIAYTGEKSPSIQLDAATKRFSGSGGCNRIMGGYTLEGGTLHFSQAAATRMACLEGMETEAAYLQALTVVDTYRVVDGKLELMHGERVRARFEAVRP